MELSAELVRDKVLIIGASSVIAQAVAVYFSSHRYDIYLLARNQNKLQEIKKKLLYHGANSVQINCFQAENLPQLEKTLDKIFQKTNIHIALIAHGILPDQNLASKDWSLVSKTIQINGISTLFILEYLAKRMEYAKEGTIAAITSLAVQNSNQKNYTYAASKAMVANFLKGLAMRLKKSGVKVVDIRPALVQTPMTTKLYKKLTITPESVALAIFLAITKASKRVVYIPSYYRWIMLFVANIPSNISSSLYGLFSLWNRKK